MILYRAAIIIAFGTLIGCSRSNDVTFAVVPCEDHGTVTLIGRRTTKSEEYDNVSYVVRDRNGNTFAARPLATRSTARVDDIVVLCKGNRAAIVCLGGRASFSAIPDSNSGETWATVAVAENVEAIVDFQSCTTRLGASDPSACREIVADYVKGLNRRQREELADLVRVVVIDSVVTPIDLKELLQLRSLEAFGWPNRLTASDVVTLNEMPRLETLDLRRASLDDVDLVPLEELRHIKVLLLPISGISGPAFRRLNAKLRNVRIIQEEVD